MVLKSVVKSTASREPEFREGSLTPSVSSENSSNGSTSAGRGKRKLAAEEIPGLEREKRRKLMNRVAAQQSRDKKRQYLTDLEKELKKLKAENAVLKTENLTIQQEKEKLAKENETLKIQKPSVMKTVVKEEVATSARTEASETFESAALIYGPLQQEQVNGAPVCRLIHLCLLLAQLSHLQMNFSISSKKSGETSPMEEQIHSRQETQSCSSLGTCRKWWGPQQRGWNPARISYNGNLVSPV